MATVHEMDHPLIKHKLSLMRDKTTGVQEFREAASEIAMLMCYEATRDLQLKEITIETPVSEARVQVISGKKIALFGSYDWGDGEWMRTWADRCTAAGAEIVGGEGLIVNLTPSDEDLAKCKALGEDLAK